MDDMAPSFIEEKLKMFIYDNFPVARTMGLETDQNMLESGAVDSMGLLTVIAFIEDEFAMQISDDDVVMENFGTMSAIAAFIRSNLQSEPDTVP